MKVIGVLYFVGALIFQLSHAMDEDLKHNVSHAVIKRTTTPTRTCNRSNEGDSDYNPVDPSTVWLCESSVWKPHRIVPAVGQTKELSAKNCKQIKEELSTDCGTSPQNGVYWVLDRKVYCDMSIDGGGWTLVWQHTYMKYNPLHSSMFYFSNHYRSCVKDASQQDWCNVPNKACFNPTEQMIVAYHKGTIVYAYKGYFNGNIDQRWAGGILIYPKKVIDKCIRNPGTPPAPSIHGTGIFGLTFDKLTPYDYHNNCDTYYRGSTLTNPGDCRWRDCHLPSSISSQKFHTDMTIAIFVR